MAVHKKTSDSYTYALLGTVALVALVAVFITLKVYHPVSAPTIDDNVLGGAVKLPHPIPGMITASVGQTFYNNQASAKLISLDETTATVDIGDADNVYRAYLHLGDSASYSSITVTFIQRTPQAGFLVATAAESCGNRDGQTALCRGTSACCGNTCVALPDCTESLDGPIMTCGDRQMYCCGGQLGFEACTSAQGCKTNADCNVDCVSAPCPTYVCVTGRCTTFGPPIKVNS